MSLERLVSIMIHDQDNPQAWYTASIPADIDEKHPNDDINLSKLITLTSIRLVASHPNPDL